MRHDDQSNEDMSGEDPAMALLTLALAWWARYRGRRELARLDTRLLRDIGLPADSARRESRKPFWKP
jgi:uncharacterized protein YjiS (DUF1127 family)